MPHHFFLKAILYPTHLYSCIIQYQQVYRNIFTYSHRGGDFLSFGYLYVEFEPHPETLLAVQDEISMYMRPGIITIILVCTNHDPGPKPGNPTGEASSITKLYWVLLVQPDLVTQRLHSKKNWPHLHLHLLAGSIASTTSDF